MQFAVGSHEHDLGRSDLLHLIPVAAEHDTQCNCHITKLCTHVHRHLQTGVSMMWVQQSLTAFGQH